MSPPSSLVAVSVSVSGGSLNLSELLQLFAQAGTVHHAFHVVDQQPSSGPISQSALLTFADPTAAARAVELFDGYPLGPASFLEVQLADMRALQQAAMPLCKCLQTLMLTTKAAGSLPSTHSAPQPQPPPPGHPAFCPPAHLPVMGGAIYMPTSAGVTALPLAPPRETTVPAPMLVSIPTPVAAVQREAAEAPRLRQPQFFPQQQHVLPPPPQQQQAAAPPMLPPPPPHPAAAPPALPALSPAPSNPGNFIPPAQQQPTVPAERTAVPPLPVPAPLPVPSSLPVEFQLPVTHSSLHPTVSPRMLAVAARLEPSLPAGEVADGEWGTDEQEFKPAAGGSLGSGSASCCSPRSPAAGCHSLGRRLYVKNVLPHVKGFQVEEVFRRFGALEEVVKFPPPVDYAFVTYLTNRAAADAFEALQDQRWQLWIEFRKKARDGNAGSGDSRSSSTSGSATGASYRPVLNYPPRAAYESREDDADPGEVTTKLWAANLMRQVTKADVKRVFGRFGDAYDICVMQGADKTAAQGQWAFVNFRRRADAKRAFENMRERPIPELTGDRFLLKLKYKKAA